MADDDIFIDAETPFIKEANTFEEILTRQIRLTADILSKELNEGIFWNSETNKTYQEDKRVLAINHVRTTWSLMKPFIKDPFKEDLKKIQKEIEEYRKKLGDEKILVKNVGLIEAKKIFHSKQSIPYGKLMEYKVEKYREIFEVLIMAYHKNKQEIRSFSSE